MARQRVSDRRIQAVSLGGKDLLGDNIHASADPKRGPNSVEFTLPRHRGRAEQCSHPDVRNAPPQLGAFRSYQRSMNRPNAAPNAATVTMPSVYQSARNGI